MNYIKIWNDLHYVVVDELPEEQRQLFRRWLVGQTCPIIDIEKNEHGGLRLCAYAGDYLHWLEFYNKGKQAKYTTNA